MYIFQSCGLVSIEHVRSSSDNETDEPVRSFLFSKITFFASREDSLILIDLVSTRTWEISSIVRSLSRPLNVGARAELNLDISSLFIEATEPFGTSPEITKFKQELLFEYDGVFTGTEAAAIAQPVEEVESSQMSAQRLGEGVLFKGSELDISDVSGKILLSSVSDAYRRETFISSWRLDVRDKDGPLCVLVRGRGESSIDSSFVFETSR